MYAIAILRYRRTLDEMQPHVDAHRAYIRDLHERGIVMAGDPLVAASPRRDPVQRLGRGRTANAQTPSATTIPT